jgi:hypothetical protein
LQLAVPSGRETRRMLGETKGHAVLWSEGEKDRSNGR